MTEIPMKREREPRRRRKRGELDRNPARMNEPMRTTDGKKQ